MWIKILIKSPFMHKIWNYVIFKPLFNSSGIVYFQCHYAKWIVDSVYTGRACAGKQKYPPFCSHLGLRSLAVAWRGLWILCGEAPAPALMRVQGVRLLSVLVMTLPSPPRIILLICFWIILYLFKTYDIKLSLEAEFRVSY